MKTQYVSTIPHIRNKDTAHFKEHALELANWYGILTVVPDLGLAKKRLYSL
jgi:hypothetical protein